MTAFLQRQDALPAPSGAGRDTGIDLVRAGCIVAVVVLHALMVGVSLDGSAPVFSNAADGSWWLTPLSWILQVMPLFFVIGGFAGATAYRAFRLRGGTDAAFVAARLHRLLVPAVVVIAVAGLSLLALAAAGVPPELIEVAGYRFGQPLWFLGVFLLCQALLPALVGAHERAPRFAIGALVIAAVAVDAVRLMTGIDGLGFINLVFVWLSMQQLGFFLADGRIDRLAPRTRIAIAITAFAVLAFSMLTGIHSPDLIANINPPTTALIMVGVLHTMVLSLLRPRLTEWSTQAPLAAAQRFVNRRAMTIYLWHMPVLLAGAGALALLACEHGMPLPTPSSLEWWLTRPFWLAAVLAVTAMIAVPLAVLESRRPGAGGSPRRVWLAVASGLASVALLLVSGTTVLTAGVAVALIALALGATRTPVRTGSTPSDAARSRG